MMFNLYLSYQLEIKLKMCRLVRNEEWRHNYSCNK